MGDDMLRESYLTDIRRTYRNYRALAEAAVAQVTDEQYGRALDADGNSIAVIMQHVSGNLRSRFSNFLTTDGEKPDRDRDAEFESGARQERAAMMARWHAAWDIVLGELDALTPSDLEQTVRIRGEAFAVVEALHRSVTHTAYHVGQVVYLAKHLAGGRWRSLSIPKGMSSEHSAGTFKKGIVTPVGEFPQR